MENHGESAMETIDGKTLDPEFRRDVAAWPGGENIGLCYACGTCTACCPVSEIEPEFNPRKIIRQVLLGLRDETLSSPMLWRCIQCYACTSKCPQNVKFREIMRALREMAVAEGKADASLLQATLDAGRLTLECRNRMMDELVSGRNTIEDWQKKLGAE